MLLQNTLDLSTFEIVRFRIWNQTSQPSDRGFGSKYFNTNSGHEAYCREEIFTPIGWRTAAYMDDIEAINEKLDLIFGEELDTDTIIDSWKEVQDFLSGIEDTKNLMTLLDDKLSKTGGGVILGNGAYAPLIVNANVGQTGVGFRLQVGGKNKALFAWDNNEGAYIYNSVAKRYIGVLDSGTPFYHDGSQYRTLLHSGNVGDYALKNYNNQGAVDYNDVFYNGIQYVSGASNNTPVKYGILMSASIGDASWQLLGGRINEGLYYRGGGKYNTYWGDWKTIAFTDSDITGNAATATKLEDDTAYTAWGQTFFENGKPKSIQGGLSAVTYIRFLDGGTYGIYRGSSFASSQNATDISYVATGHYFYINGASAMTITEEGFIGIGNDTPIAPLTIAPKDNVNMQLGTTNGIAFAIQDKFQAYGINFNVESTGVGNIQVGRTKGEAQAFALNLNPLGGAVNVGGNLAPNANNSLSFGTSSYRWSNVYSVNGDFSGRFLIGGAADDGSTALQVKNTMSIGDSETTYGLRLNRNNIYAWIPENHSYGHNASFGLKMGDTLLGAFAHYRDADGSYFAFIGTAKASPWFTINSAESSFSVLAKFNAGALIPTGQTLTIGSVTFKETATGEIEVDGNLHTTGTLASGGKGEVGENTTGNAMVYQYDLASGESVYTVDNVKGSTNVIVQIFEWNSNTSSWDMILTDVSVKADAITVTFGRTTTVNHMVTVC